MTSLTEQQRRAIDTRQVPVVLSAGAGCGKTFVLTERFLSHLDPAYPTESRSSGWHPRIAITFTERAAREMRDRIRRRCHDRLVRATGQEADVWWSLLRDIDAARVATIHSFCGDLLRSHAVEAGLDPNFQQLDETAAETLLLEVVDQQLRRRLREHDDQILDLVAHYDVDGLRNLVLTLIPQRGKHDFERWRQCTPEQLVSAWKNYRDQIVLPRIIDDLSKQTWLHRLLELLKANRDAGNNTMQERIAAMCVLLPQLIKKPAKFTEFDALRGHARLQGGGNAATWPSEDDYKVAKALLKRLRDTINNINGLRSIGNAETALNSARLTHDVFTLALDVLEAYERQKSQIPALDFDDLILRARDLLRRDGPLRRRLAAQIDLLLVDEFQDTDSVQLDLVCALCDDNLEQGRLFVVGDLKQSIYRFRGAEPEVFTRLAEMVPEQGRLSLTKNFRSQPSILHFVNALFCEALSHPQQPFEPLEAHRSETPNNPKIEFLFALPEVPKDENDSPEGERSQGHEKRGQGKESVDQQRRREADWIARRLKAMIDQGEQIVGCGDDENPQAVRAVRPGDIAILFRAMSDVAVYEEALRRHGISYYLVGGRAFFAQQEIYDLLNLLRAVNSSADELALLGALRSPIFSLDDETLFWLSQNPSNSISVGLFANELPEALDEATQQRVRFAAQTLSELREWKDRLPVAELIQRALDLTGYDAALLAEFLGTRKLANLKKLIDSARKFDRDGLFGLADFVDKLSHDVAHEPHEELAALEAEDADVVRLMSVHQAKGLEFPVVVVADIDRRGRGNDTRAAFDAAAGPLVAMPSKVWADATYDEGGLKLWKAISAVDDEQESLRLFYVATTRAADYLILSAGVSELDEPRGRWLDLLSQRFDPATGQLRAALPAGYPAPSIRVTTQRPSPPDSDPKQSRRASLVKIVDEVQQRAAQERLPRPENLAPLLPDVAARRQFSVSSLTGQLEEIGPTESQLAPISTSTRPGNRGASGALLLGTLVHDLLADWTAAAAGTAAPATQVFDSRALEKLARCRAADRGMLDPPLREACQMVRRFLETDRARQIEQATQVHVELEYMLRWPPGTQDADAPYLHGYIDCLYRDDQGSWHLLDYKTNQIEGNALADVASHYELQMFVYALAVEQCLGSFPLEVVLHFLRGNAEHVFRFSPRDRERLMQTVGQGIRQLRSPEPESLAT